MKSQRLIFGRIRRPVVGWRICAATAVTVAMLLSVHLAPVGVWAAAGDLDLTFDGDGRVTTDFGSNYDNAAALAIQQDGKIVAAGNSSTSGILGDLDFALARYNSDGSLDTSFSGDGRVSTDFLANSFDKILGIAIQSDGKIVAAGHTGTSDVSDFALARYNPDGSLDTTFGSGGKITTDFFGFRDEGRDVAIQSNGKIVVSGLSLTGNDFDFALARYNSDGSLDATFDGDGKVTTGFFNHNDEANAIAIQTDGKIIAAGNARSLTTSVTVFFALARYNPDGTLDTSFDSDGLVTTDSPMAPSSLRARDVAIQTNGKIVGAGDSSPDFLLLRYHADGSLDDTFDGDGIVTTSFGPNTSAEVRSIAFQPDGKIVAAGGYEPDGQVGSFGLARYHADGSLDTSFDADGRVTTSFGPQGAAAYAVAIQADGKIVAAGDAFSSVTGGDFGLARYESESGGNAPPALTGVAVTSPIDENSTATLTGNISDPNAGDTFIMTVDWGDGSPAQVFNYPVGTNSFSETHQYLDDNPTGTPSDSYTINLTLSDNAGDSDTDSTPVTINNAAPVLSNITASPSIITAGGTTNLSGNVTDAGTLDPHDVTISWGDGSIATTLNLAAGETAFNANHQYNAIGTFNIAVTATDDDTGSANGGTSLTVNTPPVLSNVAITSPITENNAANLSGNITEPNAGDQFSLTVDWGDGSPPQVFNYAAGTTAFNEAHQYRDDNPTGTPADNYAISLTLSDGIESDTDSATVTVNNAPPVLSNIAANPATINIGGITNLSGTVSDAGTLDTHEIVISWGDGSPDTTLNLAAGVTAFNSSHQYNTSGTFNIGVTATDDDTGSANGGASVIVNPSPQQPPVLSNVVISSPIIENGTATLTGNISDPNAGDTFVLTVNWGDGTPAQVFSYPAGTTSFSQMHQYLDDNPTATPSDNYTIDLTLNDNAGGSDTDSTVVMVNDAAPVLSNIAVSPSTINVGGSTDLGGNVNDVGTLDTHRIVINWGDGTPATTLDLAAGETAFNANHQYNTAGAFNVAVTATDDDTGSANVGASVTVNQPSGGKIAFVSRRDGNAEIYSMNPDGSNQTRLTNNAATDSYPAISPDGNRIAFASTRDGNLEIYVMNSDGTGQMRLTSYPGTDFSPSFSPDGNRIGFVSVRNANFEIYVMNADGSNQTRLTNNFVHDFDPVFSPDGNRIAFTSQRDGFGQVYLMNADGSNQTRLTNLAADEFDPSFSPDGNRIAFTSFLNGATAELYVMNADGSNQTRLTNNQAGDVSASFSPDGSQIAFVSNRDGRLEIYVMNSDGANQVRLSDNPAGNELPSWSNLPSPAGGRIAFSSDRDGNYEIYSINANGTNLTRLTNNPASDFGPSISPDGRRIAFTSNRDGNSEIYVMNLDGTSQTRLTNNLADDFFPSSSSDGNRIAFVSNRDGNYEIYVMNSDGTNPTRLTNNAATDESPTFSPDGSRIAFDSRRDGNYEIYTMNADGTNQTRLTNNSADDAFPSFNADGSRITFASGFTAQIYVMNADGTNQTRLSTVFAFETLPVFSPDSSQIVFTSYRDGGSNAEIYVMNADGTNQKRLTSNPALDIRPAWGIIPTTAAGRKIVFHSYRDGNAEIYTMNSNGTNQIRLTNNPAADTEPSFSPDGSRIVFASDRDGSGADEIYVMNADGTNPIRLTDNLVIDTEPSFSPDGSRIVFTSYRNNDNADIYVMNADGTNQIRLTNDPAADFNPTFSPDGNRIGFASQRNGGLSIYLMNSNGANPTRLTDGYEPSFSPDGNRIAFSSGEGGGFGVFLINSDGTNRNRLTNNSSTNFDPAFSPDGSQIAFESVRDGNIQIYLMNADGSNQTRLTANAANDFSPAWGGLVLAAPSNLTAAAVSSMQINLAWTDNSLGEDGFLIERCLGSNCTNFIQIARTSANVTAFASAGLNPQTSYTYRVRAFGTGGNSSYSNTAKDKTPK